MQLQLKEGSTLHAITLENVPRGLRRFIIDPPGSLWPSFNHPFLCTMLPTALPCSLPQYLYQRQEAAFGKLNAGAAETFVMMHERPYRLQRLVENHHAFKPPFSEWTMRSANRFWKFAAYVWRDSELNESDPDWTALMDCPVPYRIAMTDAPARRYVAQLPEQVTIYCGLQAHTPSSARMQACEGWSWTLSRTVAQWFSNRFLVDGITPYTATATVARSEIVAYMTSRSEAEVLIDPRHRAIRQLKLAVTEAEPTKKDMRQ